MSKFTKLLESHLGTTNLTRIRIKHDPANKEGELNEYVGYVLEEDGIGNVVAIVPGLQDGTVSLGPEEYAPEMSECDDNLTSFKKHVVKFLMHRGYHEKIAKVFDTILNANNVIDVEKVVQSCGSGPQIVIDMYRDYISNESI